MLDVDRVGEVEPQRIGRMEADALRKPELFVRTRRREHAENQEADGKTMFHALVFLLHEEDRMGRQRAGKRDFPEAEIRGIAACQHVLNSVMLAFKAHGDPLPVQVTVYTAVDRIFFYDFKYIIYFKYVISK